ISRTATFTALTGGKRWPPNGTVRQLFRRRKTCGEGTPTASGRVTFSKLSSSLEGALHECPRRDSPSDNSKTHLRRKLRKAKRRHKSMEYLGCIGIQVR